MTTLTDEENEIIIGAIKCLHHLKYISDVAILIKDNNVLLEELVEEVAKIKEKIK